MRTNFDRFTEKSQTQRFLETKTARAFAFVVCGSWCWIVTDLGGKVLGGERDWNMDAFQACDRAISFIEKE